MRNLAKLIKEEAFKIPAPNSYTPNIVQYATAIEHNAITLLRKLGGGEWMPIETAPKDGSMILVMLPRIMNLVVRARFNKVHDYWVTDHSQAGISNPSFFHQGDLWHPIPPAPTGGDNNE